MLVYACESSIFGDYLKDANERGDAVWVVKDFGVCEAVYYSLELYRRPVRKVIRRAKTRERPANVCRKNLWVQYLEEVGAIYLRSHCRDDF